MGLANRHLTDAGASIQDVIYDSGVVKATSGVAGSAKTATSVWVNHARIAVRHEFDAHEARGRLLIQHARGEAFDANEEFEASIVAITHAAIALDGFYGCVQATAPIEAALRDLWRVNRTARHRWIFETLKRRFRIRSGTNRWPEPLAALFGLRDGDVHFVEDFREPAPHPVIGPTSHERITYSPETARLAVDLMLEVLTVCTTSPRSEYPGIVDYSHRHWPLVQQLAELRELLLVA